MNKTIIELRRALDELKEENYRLIEIQESDKIEIENFGKEKTEFRKEKHSMISELDRLKNKNDVIERELEGLSKRFDHMKNLVKILKQKNPKISEIENALKMPLDSEFLTSDKPISENKALYDSK